MKNNCSFVFISFFLVYSLSGFFAYADLSSTLAKIKPGIAAVGTFHPTRHPRAVFLGTGFAIGDGSLVATNAHVIPGSIDAQRKETIAVFTKQNGKDSMIAANLLAIDKEHDLAVIKLTGGHLPPLILSNDELVKEGEEIAFTGYPIGMVLGLYPVTHTGIISAITPMIIPVLNAKQLSKKMLNKLRNPYNVFQLDATAYPGNSGSPVYQKETGQVIGIVNKVFVKESKEMVLSKPSGITYAIPIHFLKKVLKKLNK